MTTTAADESQVITGLWEELPIAADATTSRVVVDNALLRVVEFAMAAGQELTDHASPRPVVVHVCLGELEITVAGTPHTLGPGDVVYLAADEQHCVVARTDCRFTLARMTPGRPE